MILASRQHTTGDTRLWRIDYGRWLDNTATIETAEVESSSASLTISGITVLGREITFLLSGGDTNETATLSVEMTDSLGNVKHDTVIFTVVAP